MKPSAATLTASAALLLWGATACDSDQEPRSITIYQNVVTFEGNCGATALFTFQDNGDSPTVSLTLRGNVDTTRVSAGQRLLMTYSLPSDVAYGTSCDRVTLRGLQTIYTDTVDVVPAAEAAAAAEPIYVKTLYRTGNYINLYASMPALEGRTYYMVADDESLATDTARLYLSTTVTADRPTYNATQVASIDIGPVWQRPGIRAVRVNVNNSNNPYRRQFVFAKN